MRPRLLLPRNVQITCTALMLLTLLPGASSRLSAQDKADADDSATPAFRAGAFSSNITPPLGELVVGGWKPYPARHIHDELHARCLVLDDGRTQLAIVLCDNVGIPREVYDAAKERIHEATGLPIANMLMAATHTHSATTARSQNSLIEATELTNYQQLVVQRIVDGVRCALNNLEPARIGWGRAVEPSEVFNRRWHMTPGTDLPNPFGGQDKVRMNPSRGAGNLLRPAGPIDPEVAFISVQSSTGRPIALLANYSLHYVGNTGPGEVSADYFAMFADRIQQLLEADRLDPAFVGIMSNGTSGDVNNINFRERSKRMPPYAKMRIVANKVAQRVFEAHQNLTFHDWVPLAALHTDLTLAVRKPTPELLERAREFLAKPEDQQQGHVREGIYARRMIRLNESPDEVQIPLQTLRIGDLGIAAIPFEVFAEIGLEIKDRSPFKQSFTIELANGSYGYLPTPEQHELGGYETWLGTNRVEFEASRKIVQTLLPMFEQMKEKTTADAVGGE